MATNDSRPAAKVNVDRNETVNPMAIESTGLSNNVLERIGRETGLRGVEFHRELASTNDRALELCRNPELVTPQLVLAERQTAGRGRGLNRWWSAAGALTFSLVLERPAGEPDFVPISMTAGLAACDALGQLGWPSSPRPGLKWPNDVLLGGKKLCGILVEVPSHGERRVVVGVGLNVNNSLRQAPADLRARATSLIDEAGRPFELRDVLQCMLSRLLERWDMFFGRETSLQREWSLVCSLTGTPVDVETSKGVRSGLCLGIDRDGALLLKTPNGTERIISGAVLQTGTRR